MMTLVSVSALAAVELAIIMKDGLRMNILRLRSLLTRVGIEFIVALEHRDLRKE